MDAAGLGEESRGAWESAQEVQTVGVGEEEACLAMVRRVEMGEEVVVGLPADEVEAGLGAVRQGACCARVEGGGGEDGGVCEGEEGFLIVGLDEGDVLAGKARGGCAAVGVAEHIPR